jgi:hypothetical protein
MIIHWNIGENISWLRDCLKAPSPFIQRYIVLVTESSLLNNYETNNQCPFVRKIMFPVMKMTAFWDTPPCRIAEVDRRFGGW